MTDNDIEVGDDGIAVKSGSCVVDTDREYCGAHLLEKALGHGTENVLIQHSWIRHRFTKIGSNCAGTIRNVRTQAIILGPIKRRNVF